jgi:hypothetical protein
MGEVMGYFLPQGVWRKRAKKASFPVCQTERKNLWTTVDNIPKNTQKLEKKTTASPHKKGFLHRKIGFLHNCGK